MIVLDTHALIWMDGDSARLGPRARQLIEKAFGGPGIAVSAISFWECAALVARGRIDLPASVDRWRSPEIGMPAHLPIKGQNALLTDNTNPRSPRFRVRPARLVKSKVESVS